MQMVKVYSLVVMDDYLCESVLKAGFEPFSQADMADYDEDKNGIIYFIRCDSRWIPIDELDSFIQDMGDKWVSERVNGKRLLSEEQIEEVKGLAEHNYLEYPQIWGAKSLSLQYALHALFYDVWDTVFSRLEFQGMLSGDDSLIPAFYARLRGETS